jgi:Family of unknown function (DUF6252)
MKIIKSISVLVLLLFIGFATSCTTKDEALDPALPKNQVVTTNSTTNPTPVLNGTFTVSVDGQTFTATNITAVRQVINLGNVNASQMTITGISVGAVISQISVQLLEKPSNSYILGIIPVEGTVYMSENITTQNPFFITSNPLLTSTNVGQVNVISINNTTRIISGTFNCTLKQYSLGTNVLLGTKVLTNGVFNNVNFVVQ